jgi:hypothetical protein
LRKVIRKDTEALEKENAQAEEDLMNRSYENSLKVAQDAYDELGEAADRAWGADRLGLMD